MGCGRMSAPLAYVGTRSRMPPSSAATDRPAALPLRSQHAMSIADNASVKIPPGPEPPAARRALAAIASVCDGSSPIIRLARASTAALSAGVSAPPKNVTPTPVRPWSVPSSSVTNSRVSVGAGSPTMSGLSAGVRRTRVMTWVIFILAPPRRMLHRTMADYLLTETVDGVAILTLNRPDQLNALNRQLSAELHAAVAAAVADPAIGCIVITGAGPKAFSAGGDIHEQREDDKKYTQAELDAMGAERARGFYEIGACPKPTIGRINGLAYGGAGVLASSLDMRVGCEHASFRFLAAAYGRINSTWTLPNQVGWPIAKELLFTARVVEAQEAHRIGLLNHLVPREQLRAKTMELARTIAGNNRSAVIGIKRLLLKQMNQDLEQQWKNERNYTTTVARPAKAEDAFVDFIARKGRKD